MIYLLRHGATDNNDARPPRLQGRRSDPALSAEGQRQAERAAAWLAARPLAAVYASPLRRAQQTAAAIAAPHALKVETVDDLIEADVGQWEGRAWDEIQATDPEAYRLFMSDASIHPYLGGEDLCTVQARCVPALNGLARDNAERSIAVVAHNVVNRVYLAALLKLPLHRYRAIPQANCGINLLEVRHGVPELLTINSVVHLLS